MPAHLTVLLLQPENIDSDVIKIILSSEPLIVEHLSNSTDAWNHLYGHKFCDLIVLNLDIPSSNTINISSLKLLKEIQNTKNWSSIPLIIIANNLTKNDLSRDKLLLSSDSIVINPFNPIRFKREIYSLLNLNLQRHISELNKQHIEIFKQLSYIARLIDKQTQMAKVHEEFLKTKLSIIIHLEFEEQFMQSHHYPEVQQHTNVHNEIRKRLSEILREPRLLFTSENINLVRKQILGDKSHDHDEKYIEFLNSLYLKN